MKHKVLFGPAGSPINYKGAAYKAPKYISEEEIEKRRYTKTNQNAKPVVQLTLKDEYVATYSSGRQAEIQSGVAKSSAINACCNHKPKAKTAGGYKWMFKTEYDTLNK